MAGTPETGRRQFLGQAAMAFAAAPLGLGGASLVRAAESRQFAALTRATAWIDSRPLASADLVGRVTLIQFGTYTCINWLRTLPHLRAWVQTYGQDVSVIVVHTPEFAFEQDLGNVRRAVQPLRLSCPIVVDSDASIWRAFRNSYWPALYAFDARGRQRYQHFGEGEYESTERMLQGLIREAATSSDVAGRVSVKAAGAELPADWRNLQSPETYLGFDRAERFSSPGGLTQDDRRVYAAPQRLRLNDWALAGQWTIRNQPAVLHAPRGRIVYRFHARDLHLVMGPGRRVSRARFGVSLDGRPPGPAHGLDVDADGQGAVSEPRMYQLIRQPGAIEDRVFEIEFLDAEVEAYAFTFG